MRLEMPTDATCPLCGEESVQLEENKRGNPYFQCSNLNTVVNLRPETEEQWGMVSELAQIDDEASESEPDGDETPEDESPVDLSDVVDDDASEDITLDELLDGGES